MRYQVIDPRRLTPDRRQQIDALHTEVVTATYPDRTLKQVEHYVTKASNDRQDLNKAVGSEPLWRHRQRFAAPLGIMATEGSELRAYLGVANNVSSAHDGFRGFAEQQAKLYLPFNRAVQHRYLWIGAIMIDEATCAAILNDPATVNPVDVMLTLAADRYDRRQPLSAYTADEEFVVNAVLSHAGFSVRSNEPPTEVHIFGDDAGPISLRHWTGTSTSEVVGSILEKPGASEVITDARRQIGVDSLTKILL